LTQAVRWLAREESDELMNSTELRITRLLEDLHDHLAMVEGLRTVMQSTRGSWGFEGGASGQTSPRLRPAPQEVLDKIKPVTFVEHSTGKSDATRVSREALRQTPQCVICCADFEAGEALSKLPGCGHLFHDGCILEWLQRAANCPICRSSLCEAAEDAIDTRASGSGGELSRAASPPLQLAAEVAEATAEATVPASSAAGEGGGSPSRSEEALALTSELEGGLLRSQGPPQPVRREGGAEESVVIGEEPQLSQVEVNSALRAAASERQGQPSAAAVTASRSSSSSRHRRTASSAASVGARAGTNSGSTSRQMSSVLRGAGNSIANMDEHHPQARGETQTPQRQTRAAVSSSRHVASETSSQGLRRSVGVHTANGAPARTSVL